MDGSILELTPEWLEFQNLMNQAKAIGATIPSTGKITIEILRNIIADKTNELYWQNNNSISR